MKRWLFRLAVLLLVAGAVLWAWQRWFPGPEQTIRKSLREIAETASIQPNEAPFTKLNNALKLAGFCTEDVEITANVLRGSFHISGREELRQAALTLRQALGSLTVQFIDVSIALAGDRKSATAHLTGKASVPGETTPEAEEFKVQFVKRGSRWLISRADTVKTLR